MSSREPLWLMIFAEDQLSYRLTRDLAERLFADPSRTQDAWYWGDWELHKDSVREWSGLHPSHHGGKWTDRSELKQRCAEEGLHLNRIDAAKGPLVHVSKAHMLAAVEARRARPRTSVLFVALDADRTPSLRQDIQQALERSRSGHLRLVVLAIPSPEAEAWVLSGFECQSDRERKSLAALKEELRIDPITESHRLTSTTSAASDSKTCLSALSGEEEKDFSREGGRCEKCWLDTELATLEARGQANGLAEFLRQICDELLPLLGR